MDYLGWLDWFHATLSPRVYLEIGVERGTSLACVRPQTHVIGIDPAPLGDPQNRCAGSVQLFRQTSAAFFAAIPEGCGLQKRGFDLAFVDGDHRFEGVLADFMALERWAAPGAVVLLHDTLPLTSTTATRERRTGFYSGDGWKIVPCLRSLRPDLHITTLPTAPTGLTVITGLNPSSTTLCERWALIQQAYAPLGNTHVINSPGAFFALGLNDTGWMTRWLRRSVHGQ
jgi:hypothetical protein